MSRLKLTSIIITTLLIVSIVLISAFKMQYKQKDIARPALGCGTKDNQMHYSINDTLNSKGKILFKVNCVSCHNDPEKNIRDGFPLSGIQDRTPSREWVYGFVHNADSVIKSGDAYANALFKEYGEGHQPAFPNLSKDDIDAILNYCDAEWKPQTVH